MVAIFTPTPLPRRVRDLGYTAAKAKLLPGYGDIEGKAINHAYTKYGVHVPDGGGSVLQLRVATWRTWKPGRDGPGAGAEMPRVPVRVGIRRLWCTAL